MTQQVVAVGSTANDNTGDPLRTAFTKLNANDTELYSRTGGYAKFGIPFIVAPTGSMANNGALTLGTALPAIYANAYIYLPANAIQAGSSAGWYFCQMSSTTVGTVFNNVYTSGVPTIPVSTPFVSTGPGAFTGVTTLIAGPSISIPANTIGANGFMRINALFSTNNTAGNRTAQVLLGASTLLNQTFNNSATYMAQPMVWMRGQATKEVSGPVNATFGSSGNGAQFLTVDTTAPTTVSVSLQDAVATDYIVLEGFMLEVMSG